MRARMKENLIYRYQTSREFDYRAHGKRTISPINEMQAVKQIYGMDEYFKLKLFLKSIEGKVVRLVFTGVDAFEENDNNFWLPDDLWDVVE